MKKLVLASFLVLFLQSGAAGATSVLPGQEAMDIVVEDGGSQTLFLVITTDGGENITTAGEASPWILLGANNEESVSFPAPGTQNLRLNITVPGGQALGEYSATISAGAALSTLRITVTLPTGEIESLQALADVSGRIAELESRLESQLGSSLDAQLSELKGQVGTIKTELSSSISTIKGYQQEIDSLESEKASLEQELAGLEAEVAGLEERSISLESEKQGLEITGNAIRAESQILFAVGILIGAGGIYLFYRKAHKYL